MVNTMRIDNRLLMITGIVLVIISTVSFIYISLTINRDILDDSVTWFHKHVLDYLSVKGDLDSDYHLRLVDGRNLYKSPILIDLLIYSSGLPFWIITVINGIVYIFLVFIVAYIVFRDYVISGLSSLLFSFTPAFIYWFKPINYGSYVLQAWWLIPVVLFVYGYSRSKLIHMVISSMLALSLWFLWGGGWILYLVYALFIAGLIYTGKIDKNILLSSIILLTSTPLNLIIGYTALSIYHVASYIMLLTYIIIGSIEYSIIKKASRISKNSWRLIGSFSGIVIGLGLIIVLKPVITSIGLPETYSKTLDPISDYGILSVLTLFSMILILRSRRYMGLEHNYLGVLLVISVIAGFIASYFDPTLAVFSTAAASIIVGFGLKHVFTTLYYNSAGKLRVLYTVIALWIIAGSITANAAPAIHYASIEPSIMYGDLPRELIEGKLNVTAFIDVLKAIREDAGNSSVIVVSYWGFSYWIVGYLGEKSYVIADPEGSSYGWKYISKIFLTTSEYEAMGLLYQLKKKIPDAKIYIIVTSVISIESTGIAGASENAHLGYPIVLQQAVQGREAEVVYRAVGDLARFPLYIYTLGESTDKYLNLEKAKYVIQTPLSWSDYGSNTMIVRFVTNAVKALNYSAINDVYSPLPLNVKEFKYFKPLKIVEVPFKTVDTGTSKLRVEYMVAVYKVEF